MHYTAAIPALLALGASSALAAAEFDWVQFQDPAEHAFTMQVPQGWRVAGGAYRFGPLDPRAMVEMTSPDGKMRLRFGDAAVPPYAVPDQSMRMNGLREGSRYSPRGVAQEIVADYRPGWVFADLYGQARFAAYCHTLELKQMQQLPPVHELSGQERVTAGEAIYRCDSSLGAGTMTAYVFAETQLTRMQTSAIWQVTWLYSVLAPEERAATALKVIVHAMSTFQIDPRWAAYQLRLNGQAGDSAYRAFQQTVAQQQAHFQHQEAQFLQQVDSMSRALRGVTLTSDPVDHQQREVWTGPNSNYFINPTGTVVNATSSPGSEFHQLTPH
jgi:hypothetical protein